MIIGFAGRAHSGKTELARICERYGFKRLYFALPLKQLIADLLDKTIEEVNELKTSNIEIILSETKLRYLADKTNISYDFIKEKLNEKVFHNTREMLQIIGTDIIRTKEPNWHVNQIKNMINLGEDYVIDDVRFTNEKEMIQSLNGVIFFIVRPNLEHISNHVSETTLRWQQFDNLIINDKTLDNLLFKWESFMKEGFANSLMKKAQIFGKLLVDGNFLNDFLENSEEFSLVEMYFIHKCFFDYHSKFQVRNNDIEKIENFDNKIFRVYYKDGNAEIVTNPLMIEDLKFFYEQ